MGARMPPRHQAAARALLLWLPALRADLPVHCLRHQIVGLVTDDPQTQPVASEMIGAQLVSSGVSVLVNILTQGVLSGQGRTVVTTIMSFGVELPLTIGGTACLVYVAKVRGASGLLWILWVGGAAASFRLRASSAYSCQLVHAPLTRTARR